jgi:hypothetical protein
LVTRFTCPEPFSRSRKSFAPMNAIEIGPVTPVEMTVDTLRLLSTTVGCAARVVHDKTKMRDFNSITSLLSPSLASIEGHTCKTAVYKVIGATSPPAG